MPNPKSLRDSTLALTLAAVLAGCATTAPKPDPVAARASRAQPACAPSTLAASNRYVAEPFDTGLPRTGQWRDRYAVADMNGDGVPDVVHGPARKSRTPPAIFLGDGTGRYRPWTDARFPALPYDYGAVATADFNGDGRTDIALASHLRGFVTLANDGGGQFVRWGEGLALYSPTETVTTPILTSRNIATVDWNGDGRPDLVALNEGPSRFVANTTRAALGLWLNRNGGWERVRPPQELQTFGDALAIGDVDGDGRPDALIGTQVPGMRLALQYGDGAGYRSHELRSVPLDATVTAVALHDFDGDGRDDAIDAPLALDGGQYCASLQHVVVPPRGDEKYTVLFNAASRDPFVAIAVGDLDRDGRRDDVVAVRANGGVHVFAGSRGRFTRDVVVPPPADYARCQAFDAQLVATRDGALLIVSYAGDDDGSGGPQCASGGGFAAWRIAPRKTP